MEVLTAVAESPRHPDLAIGAFPNPFNPVTTIRFRLPASGSAKLRIFNVAGQEIWNRELAPKESGWQHVRWDGKNRNGRNVASGVYFAHIKQGKRYAVCKLNLVR